MTGRDLPIPFSAPMVQALLREIEAPGTGKTQTRRGVVLRKYRGFTEFGPSDTKGYDWHLRDSGMRWHDLRHSELLARLPYHVGDRLYVREHWRVSQRHDATAPRDLEPRSMTVFFEAGGSISNNAHDHGGEIRWQPSSYGLSPENSGWVGRFRQGMHMPRWASRITLDVTEVRVERLQDCSPADAMAEGIAHEGPGYAAPGMSWLCSPELAYRSLWNAINGLGAWEANPWVAAYTFKPRLGNIDAAQP